MSHDHRFVDGGICDVCGVLMSAEQAVAAFREAQKEFTTSAFRLLEAFETAIRATDKTDFAADKYPFPLSFDDLVYEIAEWASTDPTYTDPTA